MNVPKPRHQQEERPTRLIGKKDGYTFEIWVEVEGNPLKIYSEAEMEGGGLEAWVTSQEGKPFVIGYRVKNEEEYPDLKVSFVVDGSRMGSDLLRGMHSGETRDSVRAGRIMSADKIQEMLFAKPILTGEATPQLPSESLATIEVGFRRCRMSPSRPWTQEDNAKDWDKQPTGPFNENTNVPGAVIKFGNLHKTKLQTISSSKYHPEDERSAFFAMRFRYGPKNLLEELGHIPVKVKAKAAAAGLKRNRSILVDSEDDNVKGDKDIQLGQSSRAQAKKGVDLTLVPAKTPRQVKAKRAELEALREMAEMEEEMEELRNKINKKRKL